MGHALRGDLRRGHARASTAATGLRRAATRFGTVSSNSTSGLAKQIAYQPAPAEFYSLPTGTSGAAALRRRRPATPPRHAGKLAKAFAEQSPSELREYRAMA